METTPEEFSPQESLQIIQSMIDKTRHSVADNGFHLLLWGWLVFVGALLQFFLKVIVQTNAHPLAWNIMFIGLIVTIIYRVKENRQVRVRTYVDEGLRSIWSCVGFVQMVVVFVFMRRGGWENCYTIFILIYSVGCFLTGRLLEFPSLIWGGISCWALAILSTFVSYDMNILLLALAVLISYIVPGYLLKRENKKQLQKKPS
jgi:hypothetical protein